jgi:hypothetical protein
MNLRNPVQRVSQVLVEMVDGSIKERLKDEAEEVERGWGKPEVVVMVVIERGEEAGAVVSVVLL